MYYTKLWVGDHCPPPDNTYYWADTVNKAKNFIIYNEQANIPIVEISVSIDDVEYARQADGGNIPDFVSWLHSNRAYPIVRY